MSGSFRIGFSRSDKIGSKIIRWATRSKVSHVYVSFPLFNDRLVFQADPHGVAMDSVKRFERERTIVAEFEIVETEGEWLGWRGALATSRLFSLLHASYDFAAVVGFAWVLLGRIFRKKWRNPLAQKSAYFCSEFGLIWLRTAGIEGLEDFDHETVLPEDLMQACQENPGLRLIANH